MSIGLAHTMPLQCVVWSLLSRVERRHLLLPRVEITADESHESGLLSEGVV